MTDNELAEISSDINSILDKYAKISGLYVAVIDTEKDYTVRSIMSFSNIREGSVIQLLMELLRIEKKNEHDETLN
jgi:hypothetical protein